MDPDDDGGFVSEDVERRAEPRGVIRGLAVDAPGGRRLEVLEVGRKGFFVAVAEPESFLLGDRFEIAVESAAGRFGCRVEVVRKEISPRRGVALRIAHIAPAAEELLVRILDQM